MTITEAMNTYNPALAILKDKGYVIKIILNEDKEEIFRWNALKDENDIYAFNPLSLLALCTIAEQYGDNWKNYCEPDLYDELLESAE
ncbi:hypothetical protein [Aquimarina sp. RZ0]|uniref:hypothetical protein n=1 Tax=Aquimarina sp. RZ0 TaxID=2607730 RepID=UPI0011F19B7A|nr:hypothetical protein [Aquimarina sp. RZ0]KAA1246348.1 hypothetical protein F0000_07835 [Aquimarina sp. RZ0]